MEEHTPSSRRHNSSRSKEGSPKPETNGTVTDVNQTGQKVPSATSTAAVTVSSKGKSRSSTRKRLSSHQICPVCGITVRPADLEQHFKFEVDQLDHLVGWGRIARDAQAAYLLSKEKELARKKKRIEKRKRRRTDTSNSDESSSDSSSGGDAEVNGNLAFLNVRGNRQARERKKELMFNPAVKPETMLCPVCFLPLIGSEVDRSRHVETCLTEQPSTAAAAVDGQQEDPVDIEGDGERRVEEEAAEPGREDEDVYETYEWAGETRIRAVSLVQGGYQGLGYQTTSTRKSMEANDEDEDDLDVDGDETEEFGPQQYAEEDVLARCPSRSSHDTGDVGYEDHVNDNLLIEGCFGDSAERLMDQRDDDSNDSCTKHVGLPSSGIQMVMESLKARVRELEAEGSGDGRGRLKCQICMGAYTMPLVSIQCWHVHCEQCWLTTLASKKLCPQCQMITAPSQLRRIYL